jgi:hypothetical protein
MHRRDNGTAQACPPGTPVHRLEGLQVVGERLHAELFMRYKHRWADE